MIREDSIWRTRRSFTFVTAREVAYSKQGAYFLFIYLFFWETAEWDQSFQFYLTEDQRDWLTALLFLDPSVMKYFVSLWLVSHLVSHFRMI